MIPSGGPIPTYFPPELLKESVSTSLRCGLPAKPYPVISSIENEWYSAQLAAANEPSLFRELKRKSRQHDRLRFSYIPSFESTLIVRVELKPGSERLVAKKLTGQGGYEPGHIAKSVERRLSRPEASALRKLMANTRILEIRSNECTPGLDGEMWLIEGVDRRGYHYVERWSPDDGAVHTVGTFLLKLAGLNN